MPPDPFHHPGGTWRDLPDTRSGLSLPLGTNPAAPWHFNLDNNEGNACLEPKFMNFPVLLWPGAVAGALLLLRVSWPLLISHPLCWQPTHIVMLFLIIFFFLDGNNAVRFFSPPFAGRRENNFLSQFAAPGLVSRVPPGELLGFGVQCPPSANICLLPL